jgi:hypothetical protein
MCTFTTLLVRLFFAQSKTEAYKVDEGRVRGDARVAKAKAAGFPRHMIAALVKRLKQAPVQLPRPVPLDIGQGRAFWNLMDPQVAEFAFAAGQSPADLARKLGLSELAEKHRHELSRAVEASSMPLHAVLANHLFELLAQNQLE